MANRTLLINPPNPPGATANREGAAGLGYVDHSPQGFFYPPHTLAVSAAVLREQDWQVRAMDAVAEGWTVDATVARAQPAADECLVIMVSHATKQIDRAFLGALRGTYPNNPLLAIGPATRYLPDLDNVVDAVLIGEPELALPAAAQALKTIDTPHHLEAAALNPNAYDAQSYLRDLDGLPHPAWDLWPHKRYPFLSVMSSRGCDHACAYCPYVAAQGARFRPRSAASVIDEMRWLAETYQPTRVVLRDPVFAADQQRVVHICLGLIQANVALNWECESRPEHFTSELLRLMQRAGCQWVKIGLETVAPQRLVALQRAESEEQAEAYVEHAAILIDTCQQMALKLRLFVMVGLPGETSSELAQTLEFVRRHPPTALNIKAFEPYHGLRMSQAMIGAAQQPDPAMLAAFQAVRQELDQRIRPHTPLWRRARRWLGRQLRGIRP